MPNYVRFVQTARKTEILSANLHLEGGENKCQSLGAKENKKD